MNGYYVMVEARGGFSGTSVGWYSTWVEAMAEVIRRNIRNLSPCYIEECK